MKTEHVPQRPLPSPLSLPLSAFVYGLVLAMALLLTVAEPRAADPVSGRKGVARSLGAPPHHSLDAAIASARQRVKADPASEKDLSALGYLLLSTDALTDAEQAFDQALSVNARCHDALTGKGAVLARKGKDREAEAMLRQALLLNPNPVRTHYELGLLYEKKGDFDKAMIEFKKGVEKYKQGRS